MTKQQLIDLYYQQNLTLQQIGDKFGVTREYVRQVMEKYDLPRFTKKGRPRKKGGEDDQKRETGI